MSSYRPLFAYLVVSDHEDRRAFFRFYPGAIAVVSFHLLSGCVMTARIDRHDADLSRLGGFYLDRAMRLYPQFLFYSLATIAAAAFGLRHRRLEGPRQREQEMFGCSFWRRRSRSAPQRAT